MCTVTVTCLDCDVDAPPVGSDGYLGTPSLSTELPTEQGEVDGEDLPFGYVYEPLRAIMLRPRDLEGMRDFLSAHVRHEVVMWSEAQGEDSQPPRLAALLASRSERDIRHHTLGAGDDDDIDCAARQPEKDWVFGHYSVRCVDCSEECVLDEPERLQAFDAQALDREGVALMLSRWGKLAPDDGWNHALRPAVDPYGPCMERLLKFLKRHRGHRLEAWLTPVAR